MGDISLEVKLLDYEITFDELMHVLKGECSICAYCIGCEVEDNRLMPCASFILKV